MECLLMGMGSPSRVMKTSLQLLVVMVALKIIELDTLSGLVTWHMN